MCGIVAIKRQTKFRYFISEERSKASEIPGAEEGNGEGDLRCSILIAQRLERGPVDSRGAMILFKTLALYKSSTYLLNYRVGVFQRFSAWRTVDLKARRAGVNHGLDGD